jgi:hypothetical protein
MSLENAVKFVRFCLNDDAIQTKLKSIDSSDKDRAIKAIVAIGKAQGYDFSMQEYKEAVSSLFVLYEVDKKGIEELKNMNEGTTTNCTCSGCAACAACTACLACISCAWCVVVPFGGEAVIAADAAAVISAAASLSTGVSTGVAVAAQGN